MIHVELGHFGSTPTAHLMAKTRKKLGQYLLRWGVLEEQQLKEALQIAKGAGKRIGETLIDLGFSNEDDVTKALASQFDLEYIDLDRTTIDLTQQLDLLPKDLIKKFLVLPLEQSNGKLKILIHNPMDLELLDTVRFRMSCQIDTALGSRTKIKSYIERFLSETRESIDKEIKDMSIDMTGGGTDAEGAIPIPGAGSDEEDEASDAPIIRLVKKLISEAVRERASDIHIEPMTDRVRLRYRIDGVCHERDNIPKRMQSSMIQRVKILAGMKLDEKRVPQDGRIKLRIGKDRIDFRVSSCPTYHGESVVLRILRADSVRVGLINLGMEPDTLDQFNKAIRRPNGIFLVTGPTGSGKTTTLYSALDVLNRPDRKIITAEDPVEYNFTGINQCQVRADIGLTFPAILRSMLRQAPNIILVGEIRDREVADIAIQAALTGHLVFSTLHTNDAPSSITRLIDMGVKPFLVASSIQAVMGQRLIRVLCDECKEPEDNPNKLSMKLTGVTADDLKTATIYKNVGCASCGNTGYRGRKAVIEYMVMNSEIRELAFKRAPTSQIRRAAIAGGMRTLAGDGKLKILNGVTTMEEITRVAQVSATSDVELMGDDYET
jgi:type IV pilus assembly protein PilB